VIGENKKVRQAPKNRKRTPPTVGHRGKFNFSAMFAPTAANCYFMISWPSSAPISLFAPIIRCYKNVAINLLRYVTTSLSGTTQKLNSHQLTAGRLQHKFFSVTVTQLYRTASCFARGNVDLGERSGGKNGVSVHTTGLVNKHVIAPPTNENRRGQWHCCCCCCFDLFTSLTRSTYMWQPFVFDWRSTRSGPMPV
jgi:hypothetical protein